MADEARTPEQLVKEVDDRKLEPFAQALAALLYKEFGHILRPSPMGWFYAACGIALALAEDESIGAVPGLVYNSLLAGYALPIEKVEQITGLIAFQHPPKAKGT